MKPVVHLLLFLVAIVLGGIGLESAAGAATPSSAGVAAVWRYDDHHHSAIAAPTTPERGPPETYHRGATNDTVDHWSRGAVARPAGALPRPHYRHDHPGRLVQLARATSTTEDAPEDAWPNPAHFSRSSVAAEGGTAGGRAASCLNSFTADTPVTMADGKQEPISKVKVGDKVLATDPETGQTRAEPVVQLIRHSGRHEMVLISLADGSVLYSTAGHPIWNATTGLFTDASSLHAGDEIETSNGQLITISYLTDYSVDLTAYNLQISTIHTYYAGTTPVLVHNSCGMLGEGGTQVTSKTLLRDTGQGYRIDVENPALGVRVGQLHLQAGDNKYLYDFGTGEWTPTAGSVAMSNRMAASVAGNPQVSVAISRGAVILNVP